MPSCRSSDLHKVLNSLMRSAHQKDQRLDETWKVKVGDLWWNLKSFWKKIMTITLTTLKARQDDKKLENGKWLTMERIWWWAVKPGGTDWSFWEGLNESKGEKVNSFWFNQRVWGWGWKLTLTLLTAPPSQTAQPSASSKTPITHVGQIQNTVTQP